MPQSKILLIVTTLVALIGLGVILTLDNPSSKAPLVELKGDPKVPIGGPFTLTNVKGETVKEESFRGKFMLIYFGYTSCPDVCPFDLQKMALALELLEADGVSLAPLQSLFISIDPHRDSPEVAQQFAHAYHDNILGLSGTDEQIKEATRSYRIYAQISPEDEKAKQQGDYYKVNHSNLIFLMDEKGHYMKHFTPEDTHKFMASVLKSVLD